MSGKPSREDFVAFFNEADTDGSGDLTLDELTAMLKSRGYKGSDDQIKVTANCVLTYLIHRM